MSQAIIINKLAITICSTCITNGRVAQLSADHLSISSSPQVIAHSTPLGVETYLHPTLCRGGTSNQPQSIVGATYSHWVELVNIIVVVRARERLYCTLTLSCTAPDYCEYAENSIYFNDNNVHIISCLPAASRSSSVERVCCCGEHRNIVELSAATQSQLRKKDL